ncbi:MAG: thermonuclease family protein [Rhizobiaceae bacterium]|nr:MAG: thermonuclease family protein [Rhizobiaceae bacterium]CAG0972018.1 Thermonuclease [Rhizobiaceae bacterium]
MAGSRYDGARRSRQRAHADAPRRWAEKSLSRRQMRPLRFLADGIGFLALGLLAVLGGMSLSPTIRALLPPAIAEIRMVAATPVAVAQHFSLCGLGSRINCVVDGDTFYYRGEKIRLADVNTPEVSEPKCATEARLGAAATRRLQSLLNAGPIELRRGAREQDRLGRKLRSVHRDGHSLGDALVAEGLAHPWRGHKEDWCA